MNTIAAPIPTSFIFGRKINKIDNTETVIQIAGYAEIAFK